MQAPTSPTTAFAEPRARASKQESQGANPLRMRRADVRLNDYFEVYEKPDPQRVADEASRCMNCGAAFCMPEGGYQSNDGGAAGCPISNKIPEWNRLVETGRWHDAYDRLALTNNFPEFTARVCPAPCQDACIVGIHERPVGIKSVERAIIDRAFEQGWVKPRTPGKRTGRRIAVIGSGPAGLAAADQLNAMGHAVTVYERSDTPGGLLTYGIPTMKLDKAVVARRIALMEQAGVEFKVSCDVGGQHDPAQLVADHDAVLLAVGALSGRDLYLPGRELSGITLAMPYLEAATHHRLQGKTLPSDLNASGRHVVIIGGGDTGADCIATALRQGAASVTNITRRASPPHQRSSDAPWPGPPQTYTLDYAHTEGQSRHGLDPRRFGVTPIAYVPATGGQRVAGIRVEIADETIGTVDNTLPADLVILAIGFTGPDATPLYDALGIDTRDASSVDGVPGLFVAGDARQGPSLVVHAIAEGRQTAERIHQYIASRPPEWV